MAEIVNGALSVRKKDLYDHKSFSELYAYNRIIENLRDLSKKAFTQYISNGVDYWRRRHQSLGTFIDGNLEDTEAAIILNNERILFHAVSISNYRDEINQETAPKNLIFSIMEVVDGYTFRDGDALQEIYQNLYAYIELGLFPLIDAPLSEKSIFQSFEKYDSVVPANHIGTIVDVFNDAGRVYVNVMWDPNYTVEYSETMYGNKCGILRLINAIPTPDIWKDNTSSDRSNFSIPVYEFQSNEVILDTIVTSEGVIDAINTLCVTGAIKLPIIDFTMARLSEVTTRLEQILSNEKPDKMEDECSKPTKNTMGMQDPAVPVEDASVDDEFARRMRLYDVDTSGFTTGSIADDMFHIAGEEFEIQ